MLRDSNVLGALSVAVVIAGCSATTDQLRRRATIDLECSSSQLFIQAIDSRTSSVSGCGRRATYVEECDQTGMWGTDSNCTWVLNSETERPRASADAARFEARATPATPAPTPPAPAQPPSSPEVERAATLLHSGIELRRQALLQCSNGLAFDIVASYSREGRVSYHVAGSAGDEMTSCVQRTLGEASVSVDGTAGAIVHGIEPC